MPLFKWTSQLTGALALYAALAGGVPRAAPELSLAEVLPVMIQANEMLVETGKLAQTRATDAEIASYGERLWRDHQFAVRALWNLADEEQLELTAPAESSASMTQMRKRLAALSELHGQAFDRQFVASTRAAEVQILGTLTQALMGTPDPDARSLFKRWLPIIGQHLALAQHLSRP